MITQNKGRFEILGFVNLIMSSEQYHLYCDMLLVMLSVNRWGTCSVIGSVPYWQASRAAA